ncbi:hypothetical protein [Phenylobacterium sp. J367]|uniref:hypothetical protein n=1 Tax=Phenylobacterium sp. J367 TaxID=2898435 RepID=UPI00215171DB|nr:hypothetical protein [Phenylobacterium sp. J367]MCR5877049.1 hypothetical protein [Phenylobacterium sp. J367]
MTEHHGDVRHHKNRHTAEKLEGVIPVLMLIAVAILGVFLIWGLMNGATPSYLK